MYRCFKTHIEHSPAWTLVDLVCFGVSCSAKAAAEREKAAAIKRAAEKAAAAKKARARMAGRIGVEGRYKRFCMWHPYCVATRPTRLCIRDYAFLGRIWVDKLWLRKHKAWLRWSAVS